MKIAIIVVAYSCKDSKVAVNNNTGWNTNIKQNTIGQECPFSDWKKTEELGRKKDYFVST